MFIRSQESGFPGGSEGKESACNVGDPGSIPGLGRSSGEGHGYPFQYSGLETATDRGVWWATVHGITKSQTRLSDCRTHRKCNFHLWRWEGYSARGVHWGSQVLPVFFFLTHSTVTPVCVCVCVCVRERERDGMIFIELFISLLHTFLYVKYM